MVSMVLDLIGGRKTLYGVAVGFLVGLIIGWGVLAFLRPPFEYTDAAPVNLHPTYRNEVIKAVADAYSVHGNAVLAETILLTDWDKEGLGQAIGQLIAETTDEAQAQRLNALAQALNIPPETITAPTTETPVEKPSLVSRLLPLCGAILLIVLVIAAATLIMRLVRGRGEEGREAYAPTLETIAPEMAEAMPSGVVLGHFITSYALGNDHYDDSFSIETDAGEFLGECGVGIGETIGVGSPDKVTALEVWLFDKNDIRTETKVLMSGHAFGDEALRSKLAPKGEPVLAEPSQIITLETASLQVTAQVTEMEYGDGGMPGESYFSRISIELVVSIKQGGAGAEADLFG
jgi:hypothetical protein